MSPVRIDRTQKPHISRGMGTTARIAVPGAPGPVGPGGSDADVAAYINNAGAARAAVDARADLRAAEYVTTQGPTNAALVAAFVGLGKAATGVAATDTANLQAILTASATKRQRLPKGTYIINATLTIPTGADVDFGGATIRRPAGPVFDMVKNADAVAGNSNITLRNLIIDGNRTADGRVNTNPADRFGGLVFNKVTDSLLENVTTIATVNNELTAGVYLYQCARIRANDLHGWDTHGTAILLWESTRININGSLTHDNNGSGISSYVSPECAYTNITTYSNGSSNLSVNGARCLVSDVLTYSSGFSGLNIGHVAPNNADSTQVTNVVSFNNTYEGITVTDSKRVSVTNFEVYGNVRNNIRVVSGTDIRLSNGTVRNSAGGQGVYLEAGSGHLLSNLAVYGNVAHGVNINTGVGSVTCQGVKSYNNGATTAGCAGFLINASTLCKIIGCDAYDDQGVKTQDAAVWISAGSNHIVSLSNVPVNKTYGIRQTGAPTGLVLVNNIV